MTLDMDATHPTAFDLSYARLSAEEFGFADNPLDSGGPTYDGITFNSHPEWPGWKIIEEARGDPAFPRNIVGRPDLEALAKTFFLQRYWIPLRCDQLAPVVAMHLLDLDVNVGDGRGVALFQRCLSIGGSDLKIDGVMGPATLAAAQSVDPDTLALCLENMQGGYYEGLAASNPAKFGWALASWRRRAGEK